MTPAFKFVLVIWAVMMYVIGYIAWRVQNDAIKRGYSSITATFWALGVLFFTPVMLPLYVVLRDKRSPVETKPDVVAEAKKKLNITCPFCGEDTNVQLTQMSYAFKLLLDELKSLGITPSLILDDKI